MDRKVKVLLGESTFDFNLPLTRYLSKHGCDVWMQRKDLYSEIEEFLPDVIIVNAGLFNGDIVHFIDSYTNKSDKRIHIIVLMPYTNSRYKKIVTDAGAVYLELPCEFHKIYEEIMIKNNFTDDTLVTDKIKSFVRNFGVSTKLKGYEYICTAVYIEIYEKEQFRKLTKNVYPEIAERHNTNYYNVERCIRNCINVFMSDRENSDYIKRIVNVSEELKMTNSKFIKIIVQEFKRYYLRY